MTEKVEYDLKEILTKLDNRFETLETKLESRFEKLDSRFETLETKLESRFEKLDSRFEKLETKLGSDDALTLITEYETMSSEERLWFASPNLRMRVSVLKRYGGFSMASFTSEIRTGGLKPTAETTSEAVTPSAN
jgi:hypothetical protein